MAAPSPGLPANGPSLPVLRGRDRRLQGNAERIVDIAQRLADAMPQGKADPFRRASADDPDPLSKSDAPTIAQGSDPAVVGLAGGPPISRAPSVGGTELSNGSVGGHEAMSALPQDNCPALVGLAGGPPMSRDACAGGGDLRKGNTPRNSCEGVGSPVRQPTNHGAPLTDAQGSCPSGG